MFVCFLFHVATTGNVTSSARTKSKPRLWSVQQHMMQV